MLKLQSILWNFGKRLSSVHQHSNYQVLSGYHFHCPGLYLAIVSPAQTMPLDASIHVCLSLQDNILLFSPSIWVWSNFCSHFCYISVSIFNRFFLCSIERLKNALTTYISCTGSAATQYYLKFCFSLPRKSFFKKENIKLQINTAVHETRPFFHIGFWLPAMHKAIYFQQFFETIRAPSMLIVKHCKPFGYTPLIFLKKEALFSAHQEQMHHCL